MNVGTIILTGSGAVEQLIVLFYQRNAPLRVLPDPVGKSVLYDLLFLLRQHGFPLVQHTFGFALGILNGVVDTHCYHQTVKEYKSNGSLIRSKTDYYQAIGG